MWVCGQTHACKCLLWSEGGLGLDRLDLELQVVSDPLHPGGRNYRCSSPLNPLPSPTLRTVLTVSIVEKLRTFSCLCVRGVYTSLCGHLQAWCENQGLIPSLAASLNHSPPYLFEVGCCQNSFPTAEFTPPPKVPTTKQGMILLFFWVELSPLLAKMSRNAEALMSVLPLHAQC